MPPNEVYDKMPWAQAYATAAQIAKDNPTYAVSVEMVSECFVWAGIPGDMGG